MEFLGCKQNRKKKKNNTFIPLFDVYSQFSWSTLKIRLKPKTHTNNFVYSIMVIKRHKAESPLLPSGAFFHDVNAFNLSILLKILPDVVLLRVLLDAADKDLLHCQMGARFIGVLERKEKKNMNEHTHTITQSVIERGISFTSLDTALLGSTTRPSTL